MLLCVYLVIVLGVSVVHGQFMLSFGTPTPAAPSGPLVFDPNCKDKLDNCYNFPSSNCKAPYVEWAKDFCPNRCGFCKGPTTPAPACVNKLPNCESYGLNTCSNPDYKAWAGENCRYYCKMCSASELAILDSRTTTVSPADCVDKVDCRQYGANACSGTFKAWSKDNCKLHCGYCVGLPTPPPLCEDKIPNCALYNKDTCTNPDYKLWSMDNCKKYCGLCGTHTFAPPLPGSPSHSVSGGSPPTPAPPAPHSMSGIPTPIPPQPHIVVRAAPMEVITGGGPGTPAPPKPFYPGQDIRTITYSPPTPPKPGKREEAEIPVKRQFHASHHHHGGVHDCWDSDTGAYKYDDTYCLTPTPILASEGTTTPIESVFPGSDIKPNPTAKPDWDHKPTKPSLTTVKTKPPVDTQAPMVTTENTMSPVDTTQPPQVTDTLDTTVAPVVTTSPVSVTDTTNLPVTDQAGTTVVVTTSPPTMAPTTEASTAPPTMAPTTEASTAPPTMAPTTEASTAPPTMAPTTDASTAPPTMAPTTEASTAPPTMAPTTEASTAPPTMAPTTDASTAPPTMAPTTEASTAPPTMAPTTDASTAPLTMAPTTEASTAPSTMAPTTEASTAPPTMAPTTETSTAPPTMAPTTEASTAPPTMAPTTEASTAPPTMAPTTEASTAPPTMAPITKASTAPPTMAPTTTTTIATTTVDPCFDKKPNCALYGGDLCTSAVYKSFATYNCPLFCDFCTPSTPYVCENKEANCGEFDSGDLCTSPSLGFWAREHCFEYCGFHPCEGNRTTIAPTTTPVPITTVATTVQAATNKQGEVCRDVADNCFNLPDDQCLGKYEPWAKSHCAKRCGFCGVLECTDKTRCDLYPSDVCTSDTYIGWARQNCRKHCNLCFDPFHKSSTVHTTIPSGAPRTANDQTTKAAAMPSLVG